MKRACSQLMLLVFFTSIALSSNASGMSVIVTGKVTDENGQGLPGVVVKLKGTSTVTTTNVQGTFSITTPDNTGTLVLLIPATVARSIL
ncbi:carboxypeptidase-like regulatory domain-containing protein [Mucilaginibacter gracilis]|nr:carboxypeptidase-like regulatory domain-containing protein [Mucilaginibacter gracilis]